MARYTAVLRQHAEDEWGYEVRLYQAPDVWDTVAEGVGHDRRDALAKAEAAAGRHRRQQTWTPEFVDLNA